MSWSVLPLTFLFWRRVICHQVSPTRRFGLQNPELFLCVHNSVILVFFCQQPETTLEPGFRAMFVWFSYPEKTWRRWQGFAKIAPCAYVMRLFNDLGKVSMFKISLNQLQWGIFTGKNSNHSAHQKTFFSLQTWKVVEMTFFDYNSFCFWVTKICDCIITPNARYAKTLTSQQYITSLLIATKHRQK